MENTNSQTYSLPRNPHVTQEVVARAKDNEMIRDLIQAVVCAAADYDMYSTGKTDPVNQDHEGSYWYFRMLLDRLDMSPQAIIDAIDESCPDDPRDNLTESQASTN